MFFFFFKQMKKKEKTNCKKKKIPVKGSGAQLALQFSGSHCTGMLVIGNHAMCV